MSKEWHQFLASTFADPDDVIAFRRCKDRGGSDQECFLIGDNGIGCWGDDTTSTHEHLVALHHDVIVAKWGSLANGKHRLIQLVRENRVCLARLGDRCGIIDRIDLNPACQKTLDVPAGALLPVRWRWME